MAPDGFTNSAKILLMLRSLATFVLVLALVACILESPRASERSVVSPAEFRRLVGEEEVARLRAEALREADRKALSEANVSIEREGSKVRFRGPILPSAVTKLAQALADVEVKELWIESDGGYVEAGQQIGRLIRDRGLVVVVTGACISSCANYLFTAGRERVIRPEGFVVWHGSSFQKEGREFDNCGRVRSSFDGTLWTPDEIAERLRDTDGVRRRQQGDLDFFASIGVDEYITRVGQEPRFFGNFTLTVRDMERLGLMGIAAPADYGTAAFCGRVNERRPSLELTCVEVSDAMLAYERARRALGEICAADGSLVIATRSTRALIGVRD